MIMGMSTPKVPPPPPPPQVRDEADVVNLAALMAQRQGVTGKGLRGAFLGGPRGPSDGTAWQPPEAQPAAPVREPYSGVGRGTPRDMTASTGLGATVARVIGRPATPQVVSSQVARVLGRRVRRPNTAPVKP